MAYAIKSIHTAPQVIHAARRSSATSMVSVEFGKRTDLSELFELYKHSPHTDRELPHVTISVARHDPGIVKRARDNDFAPLADIAQKQDHNGDGASLISFNVGNSTVQYLATLHPADSDEDSSDEHNSDIATFIDLPEHEPETSGQAGEDLTSVNFLKSGSGSGSSWLTAITGAIYKLGGAAIKSFPNLVSFGFKVGSKFVLRGSRFYPEGCECYWKVNGKHIIHRKTGIVLSCDWERHCKRH